MFANDTDPDGDPLTAELFVGPLYGGTLDLRSDGSFTYTPPPGFTAPDSFTYAASDTPTSQTMDYVYLRVTRAAIARDDAYGALTGVERRVPAPGVLANDDGAERARLATSPDHGTASVGANGHFTYTSDAGFVGADSFTYEARVRGEHPSLATVTLTVKATNRRPHAAADDFTAWEDIPLDVAAPGPLANDTDPDGDPLTAQLLTRPYGDGFDFHGDGSFSYWPREDYDGPVQFTYRVTDGIVYSKPVTSTIDITADDDPPTAEDDSYSMYGAASPTVPAPGVLRNDHDDVESDALFAVPHTSPRKGTLDLHSNGSFTYTRTPGRRGIDYFTSRVDDSGGAHGGIGYVTIYPNSA